jgi:hypothetical protein
MSLSRCLAVLGCLCLLAIPARAQSTATVCSFGGAATDTNYTEYSTLGSQGFIMTDGPPGAANYYRLTSAGVGNTIAELAFDVTAPGPSSHIVVDFDFRIGGTADNGNPDNHADGMGFVLLNTAIYGATGRGPQITDEAQGVNGAHRDNSFGFGLDTWDNGPSPPHGGANPTYDPDNNHLGLTYIGGGDDGPGGTSILLETSLTPFGYNLHRGSLQRTHLTTRRRSSTTSN